MQAAALSRGAGEGVILPHPTGHLAKAGDIFGCHHWRGGGETSGIWWVETWDAAQHPATRGTSPTAESDLVLDVGGAAMGMETDQSRVVTLDQPGGGAGECAEETAA